MSVIKYSPAAIARILNTPAYKQLTLPQVFDMVRRRFKNGYPYPGKRKYSPRTTPRKRIKQRVKYPIKTKNPKKKKRTNFKMLNVKADRDGRTRTKYTIKVTRQQQRKINKAMKTGYSPFKVNSDTTFQDTIPDQTNQAKYVWFSDNKLRKINDAFKNWPVGTVTAGWDTLVDSQVGYYVKSQNQQIYFYKNTMRYEIQNPTNYDITLVIYDIVCKQDTDKDCSDQWFSSTIEYNGSKSTADRLDTSTQADPITLMKKGVESVVQTNNAYNASDPVIVSDPTQDKFYDINYTPSQSYPFNIYWKIVGKKTIKLQPGATHFHKFHFKPKALWNRGYFGYRYMDSDKALTGKEEMGIKDFTCGTLFKYWGQTAAEADSGTAIVSDSAFFTQDHTHATSLSGRIAIKTYQTSTYYCIDDKYTYTFSYHNSWTPADEETLPLPTATNISHPEDDQMADDSGEAD
ncbi:Cap [Gemycircularvirus sp.]|nr:Cap [Gemycircularvirus sp.]